MLHQPVDRPVQVFDPREPGLGFDVLVDLPALEFRSSSRSIHSSTRYTALAVAEQSVRPGETRTSFDYAFRHLHRWPLATSYPQIGADVRCMLAKVPGAELVVDETGCGRAILDLFRYGDLPAPVVPITITGGTEVMPADHGGHRVPKRDLVSAVRAGGWCRKRNW